MYGFANEGLRIRSGDSGGAVFQGQTAVGVVSGGIDSINFSVSTDLVSALKLTPGYTVMLALPTPTITTGSGAEVPSNGALTGTASPGATVVVTVNGSAAEVVADASGRWSLPAGSSLGRVDFTVQERDGFNRSEAAVGSATIVLAPVGFDPLDGLVHSAPTVITGTGFPGATVNLTGDVAGTAVVAADGSWSIPVTEELAFGAISISATQSVGTEVSPIATLSFEYAIEAPVIESPADGATFAVGSEPTVVTGRVVPGAEVTATLNGVALSATQTTEPAARAGQATVAFSFDLPTVAVGSHKIEVTQVIAGERSVSTSTFDILAAPVVNPTGPAGVITPGGNLPATGTDPLLAVWAGALILLLGGGAVLAKRRFGQRNG
ncbi:LPXTG cell wall anchor domain-containing protein [Mycetocola tolaasinivorans]|uniref:LPXTG cell wall anchor domain-containing protein n=1 Tax=Mycetocola tolaasinivorans TaxID=76635 RepID=A0A3L6ZVG3_9MICO|nr:LPXTG cell wall anchor domain-containing protein [Mycetocola tolaasinivorans]